jgi:hypothetical protein
MNYQTIKKQLDKNIEEMQKQQKRFEEITIKFKKITENNK